MQNRKSQSQMSGKSVKSIQKQDGELSQNQDYEDTHQPLRDRVPQETSNEEDRATSHYVYRPESTGTNSRGNKPAYGSVLDKIARNSPTGSYVTHLVKRP